MLIYALQKFTATDGTSCSAKSTYTLTDAAGQIAIMNGQAQLASTPDYVGPGSSRVLSVRLTSAKTLPFGGGGVSIPWDVVAYGDPTGIWTIGDPTKLYIPSGYTEARFRFCLEVAPKVSDLATDVLVQALILRNGAAFNGYGFDNAYMHHDVTTALNGCTTRFPVTAGQGYTVDVLLDSATANQATVFGDYKISWFEVELFA